MAAESCGKASWEDTDAASATGHSCNPGNHIRNTGGVHSPAGTVHCRTCCPVALGELCRPNSLGEQEFFLPSTPETSNVPSLQLGLAFCASVYFLRDGKKVSLGAAPFLFQQSRRRSKGSSSIRANLHQLRRKLRAESQCSSGGPAECGWPCCWNCVGQCTPKLAPS